MAHPPDPPSSAYATSADPALPFVRIHALHGELLAQARYQTAASVMTPELLAITAALESAYNTATEMQMGADGFDNMTTSRYFGDMRTHLLAATEEILLACRRLLQ